MWSDEDPDKERGGWPRRLGRIALGFVLLGGFGGAIYFIIDGMSKTERHAVRTVTRITLPPPPVPPPPPPPPEPPKVVETPKIQEPKVVEKKDPTPPKPQQPPASPLTSSNIGSGTNPYGIQAGADGGGNVIGGGEAARATYQAYARVVSQDVQAALRRDEKLRFTKFVAELRVYLEPSGRVKDVKLTTSSGDSAVDSAVTRALVGLAMRQPPPKDMPQPIRLRTKSEPG